LLVVVVAVGWKCTPRGHEPLHALFGLGDFRHRRRRTRRRGKTTYLSQVTDKLSYNVVSSIPHVSGIRTHVSGDRH
jgi:hypothetical protein